MNEKEEFKRLLGEFANSLGYKIAQNDEWTIKGFIDIFKNIYTISSDTKVISKILELHLFPYFLSFAEENGYKIELADCQNWYPDMTFIKDTDARIKFAVDIKTTYREEGEDECNGFTLGSHGEYFCNRKSTKNIQYPYEEYVGHFCLGIIYTRVGERKDRELKRYNVDEIEEIPSVIRDFIFFAEEKWKIASDKGGSGNTANIGSVKNIKDLISGNGVFAKAGEQLFDEYWKNYGKITQDDNKKIRSFYEFLKFRNMPLSLCNKYQKKRNGNNKDTTDQNTGD